MTTLLDLKTDVARDLRDTGNATWSVAELADLINAGFDQVASFYPREIVTDIASTTGSPTGAVAYTATDFTNIYRIDVISAAGSYLGTVPHGVGDGPESGWELHGGYVYLPPSWTMDAGAELRAWGYGRYAVLTNDSDSTDADQSAIAAMRIYCQVEAYRRLLADRAAFQQWQSDPGNTDVSALSLNQIAFTVSRRWAEEQRRMRRMRKLG